MKKLKTLSYDKASEEKIIVRGKYYFGQLWDGSGDANNLLDESSVSPDNINIVEFKIMKRNVNPLDTVVIVTDVY